MSGFAIDSSILQSVGLLLAVLLGLISISFVVAYTINRALRRWLKTGALFIAGATQTSIILAGIYQIALYFGAEPTVVLAAIAILTAGVSLSAEGAFANFLSGMILVMTNRFSVGEQVTIGDTTGIVKQISLFAVTMQVNTRGIVTIPNRVAAETVPINHTRLEGIELSLNFPFYNAHNIDLAIETIRQAVGAIAGIHEKYKILHGWDNNCETYALVVRVIDYTKRREVLSELSMAVTKALREANLPLGSVTFIKMT